MWIEAEKFLLKDKYIGPLIKKWGSCTIKPIKKSLYFEDLVDAICSQQLSGKAAKTIFGRVKKTLVKVIPENVLNTEEKVLREAGLSYAKIKYIKDLASRVMNNTLKIDRLDTLPDEEVINELVAVKGIGKWTAEMFLMFSLARPDTFPIDDLGIKKGFEKVTGREFNRTSSPKFAERYWKPYRTVASWYLWRSLDEKKTDKE